MSPAFKMPTVTAFVGGNDAPSPKLAQIVFVDCWYVICPASISLTDIVTGAFFGARMPPPVEPVGVGPLPSEGEDGDEDGESGGSKSPSETVPGSIVGGDPAITPTQLSPQLYPPPPPPPPSPVPSSIVTQLPDASQVVTISSPNGSTKLSGLLPT